MTAVETKISTQHPVHYKTVRIDNQDIFYREAGPQNAPVILLLHGFPTSSNMFRNLIPRLSGAFRLVAPDYPGYGQSSMPDHKSFSYTFDSYAKLMDRFAEHLGLSKYALYLMDYGAPVGYRLALLHPERVTGLIVQNGNAYEEGLREFWDPIKKYWANPEDPSAIAYMVDPKQTRWQYENGVSDKTLLDPTTWTLDQIGLDRPGQCLHPGGSHVRLRDERSSVSGLSGLLPEVSAANLDCVGKERFRLSARGCIPLQTRSQGRRDAFARHRALRARDAWRRNREQDRGLLPEADLTG
jgi:pimeloyl-ACP methyl ester carboxylesterase